MNQLEELEELISYYEKEIYRIMGIPLYRLQKLENKSSSKEEYLSSMKLLLRTFKNEKPP